MRRLSYESVKNFIEHESGSGCKLISKKYLGNKHKLKIKCKCGEVFETKYSNFTHKNKRFCNKCSKKIYQQKSKHKYEEVSNYIKSVGCELLSEEYINCDSDLLIRCSCGDIFEKSYYQFKNRNIDKCRKCLMEEGRIGYDYDFVNTYINKNSKCKLISKSYTKNNELLDLICGCGSFFKTRFSDFKKKNKKQCNECSLENAKSLTTHTYDYVREYIENNSNCKINQDSYEGTFSDLNLKCGCGNLFTTSFNNFKNGKDKCSECTSDYLSRKFSFSYQYVSNYIKEKTKFELLSTDYVKAINPLKLKCYCGRVCYVSFAKIKYNDKFVCNYCSPYHSKGEKKIYDYLNENGILFKSQKRYSDLRGIKGGMLSYDFYLREYNLLIEYQGEHHDGTCRQQSKKEFEIQKNHDKLKREYAESNNIELFEIWYWDYDRVEDILSKKLKINNK